MDQVETPPAKRDVTISADRVVEPLRLHITIIANGGIRLNEIDTGTISDTTELGEKLRVVFADRKLGGIANREVIVESDGRDISRLVEELERVGATPIRIIKAGN